MYMHHDETLQRVVHIFDLGWHGIRAASGYCPGIKIGIDHRVSYPRAALEKILAAVTNGDAVAVVFQGFSAAAEAVAMYLHENLGTAMPLNVVTHVSPAQFENHFEMDMLARLIRLKRFGVITRIGSVKPGFSAIDSEFSKVLIVNPPPNIPDNNGNLPFRKSIYRNQSSVFIPLENTWRKNLYTNFIAFEGNPRIDAISMVNYPSFIDLLSHTAKLQITGFMNKPDLLAHMSSVGLVSNVTLIECQPMTQLEALAVGTPCLTLPLFLPGFEKSEYRRLTEVRYPDDIYSIRERTNGILEMWERDEDAILGIMEEHYNACVREMRRSYREFLNL
ncbi:hypothetical protein [Nitratireductor sp. XY-223]|uniref:hypothetical protein n=1 Tax=Nitratireductor sp. XY-223 TaxID=2561926 RepID=UPI0010AA7DD3|nr:hypothetical protein [Nitratireductor sp. XY-223]